MDYDKLTQKSNLIMQMLSDKLSLEGDKQVLVSIKKQMEFINGEALNAKNPLEALPEGKVFSFGVLASKELTGSDEVELTNLIDDVSQMLDEK